jgi:hypothetical protein
LAIAIGALHLLSQTYCQQTFSDTGLKPLC